MERDLLTTREVAKILGVGTTSIKRWADSGLLRCVKTPGGHRRFPREGVDLFLERGRSEHSQVTLEGSASRTQVWLNRLKDGISTNDIVKALYAELRSHGTWYDVADSLSLVLEEVGRLWARGDLSVIQEHIITERLGRAIARVVEAQPTSADQPRTCVLMSAEDDEQVLSLNLMELCLREIGWNTTLLDSRTRVHAACEFVLENRVDLLAVSASENARDTESLRSQSEHLGRACETKNIPLILSGAGSWPADGNYGHRVITFAQLHNTLQNMN